MAISQKDMLITKWEKEKKKKLRSQKWHVLKTWKMPKKVQGRWRVYIKLMDFAKGRPWALTRGHTHTHEPNALLLLSTFLVPQPVLAIVFQVQVYAKSLYKL